MRCPACRHVVSQFYKCDKCGDVRCSSSTTGGCANSKGPFGRAGRGGGANKLCHACRKGHYKAMK